MMKTSAVRLYGKNDLRLEQFALPPIAEDEILARVVSDSICMSSYKATVQGAAHKRVPDDVAERPVIIGHEFCGEIVEVGAQWREAFRAGQRFTIQPALNYQGKLDAPGYSYAYIGGDATYIVIPQEVMRLGCLLLFEGDAFYHGSLAEPLSCIIGTYHAMYHTKNGVYTHEMGIVAGGSLAILAGAGPMGMGAIDYALHGQRRPKLLVVTDIDDARLSRVASIYTVEEASRCGVKLVYCNTAQEDAVAELMRLSGGKGYDDVLVMAPVGAVVEQADAILGRDGCLNFFAGPSDATLSAKINMYNVHYNSTHMVGTSGGNTDDLREALDMMARGELNGSAMITHVGGLDAVVETTKELPHIPGGKKLVYTHIKMPMTAIADFAEKGKENSLFAELADIVARHNGLWCAEAERVLLQKGEKIGA